MSLYGGIDLHANNSVIVVINEQDEVIYRKRLPNALPTILEQLSLSRLNHWLPRCETHSEVMQGTAQCHHEITDAVLPQPDAVFHNAAAFDATIDMLDPEAAVV